MKVRGMSKRSDMLRQLEKARGDSRVIVYITSDRQPPFQAKMALDVLRPYYEHLTRIGHVEQIDLLIFSCGGDTIAPWRLVNLTREFCHRFCVLVPYKAHSAATLLALGADEIVMGPMGELSPIDPSISTPFNPPHPDIPNEQKLEIGVEDVNGFINLAKERAGIISQESIVQVFGKLADRIHPLAIGGVYRSHALIRLLAANMLALHTKKFLQVRQIPKIVDDLAEKLFYHNYLINRDEAKKLKLKVRNSSEDIEKLMWDLYLIYEREMELGSKPFDPRNYAGGGSASQVDVPIAFVESIGLRSKISKHLNITPITGPLPPGVPPGPQFAVQETIVGWTTEETKEE